MGFFKDLKNKVTGGAATVNVQLPQQARRGQGVPVQIQATAKANGKVTAVYILVRATESCEWKNGSEKIGNSKTSYESRIQVSGPQDIKEGETYNWQGLVELPVSAHPTLRGSLIEHSWELQAGLDMPGNDPDSGWQRLEVQ